jgi:hypothetical protein
LGEVAERLMWINRRSVRGCYRTQPLLGGVVILVVIRLGIRRKFL